ncbi:DUF930 domain-containing protein [Roseibium polysiphoniae]|uniref:DUF930 domain-containing protein n=1 Tax=Roseibium polysiphoniae TaxID=2571221 RepID=A0ABR9C8D6_9HYPH|nr:DUF930 domain-containing protein [Roseibium polysiphoniae]MBD8876164.1 DUF930 domain-containing protein [Roseibium polysiphoniae]
MSRDPDHQDPAATPGFLSAGAGGQAKDKSSSSTAAPLPGMRRAAHLDRRSGLSLFGLGLLLSLLLHLGLVVVLIGGVSLPEVATEPEPRTIQVELVPPPEPEIPEPELPEPEIPEPEEPEPETPEEPEPEPEPEEQEQEPAAEEPPPPPEPAPEPEEPAESETEPAPAPLEVLQPVVEFGEEDSSSGEAQDGDAAEEPEDPSDELPEELPLEEQAIQEALDEEADAAGEPDAELTPEADPDAELEPELEQADEDAASETLDAETEAESEAEAESESEAEDVPEADEGQEEQPETEVVGDPGPDPGPELAPDTELEDFGTVGRIVSSATPNRKPAAPSARSTSNAASGNRGTGAGRVGTRPVRRLLSDGILNNGRTRTAMAGMSRAQRMDLLCMTELRAQLRADNPARPPEALPSFRQPAGNVLEPGLAAFRAAGQWYDLAFRCEVDDRATRVLNFRYGIGRAVPRSEWQRRGFPNF